MRDSVFPSRVAFVRLGAIAAAALLLTQPAAASSSFARRTAPGGAPARSAAPRAGQNADAKAARPRTAELQMIYAGSESSVDLNVAGVQRVAILGDKSLDAATIDPTTVTFAGAHLAYKRGAAPRSTKGGAQSESVDAPVFDASDPLARYEAVLQDVNGDGRRDFVASFQTSSLGDLKEGLNSASLRAKTFAGVEVSGSVPVQAFGHLGACCSDADAADKVEATQFCNTTAITIPASGAATPYPSNITVSGLTGVVSKVTVTISNFTHTFDEDVVAVLVGPTGQKMVLFSQVGDGGPVTNATLTFDDASANYVTNVGTVTSGTYKPTNYTGAEGLNVAIPAPAPTNTPASPYANTLSAFRNTNPNGTWSLYVFDIATPDSGSIAGGWCLNIDTLPSVSQCAPTLFQGALAASDSAQTSRLFRAVDPSQCDTLFTCPGTSGSASLRYDTYTITNQSGSTQCVTVTPTTSCGANIFLSAYNGSYTPGSGLCTNYYADAGSSPVTSGMGQPMAFPMTAGQTVVLVVNNISAGVYCAAYSLLVEGNICTPCVLTCPSNVTVPTDEGQSGATVNYSAPTTSGPCGTVTCTPPSGSFFPTGTTTVTCSVTSETTCSFTVTVNDAEAPLLSCPTNVTVSNSTGNCSAVATYTVTATDNDDPTPTIVCSPQSGSTFPVGSTTVTCTATDDDNNSSQCSFAVVVNDTQAPTIACSGNVTEVADMPVGCTLATTVSFATPTASDNCGNVSVVCEPASGSVFATGTTTVTCTATDAAGNTQQCAFGVTVTIPNSVCLNDEQSHDSFLEVVDPASPLYGFWRYHVFATGEEICGVANKVTYQPSRSLVSYDNNYSSENPSFYMDVNVNFGTKSGTVNVSQKGTSRKLTLRDRNIANNPPCDAGVLVSRPHGSEGRPTTRH